MNYIAFDSHKAYTLACVERPEGGIIVEQRIDHEHGAIRQFLSSFDPGSPVAVETIGNWYWIVDEIEAAGMVPKLVHARKAKLMMGSINKTDKLDARGLNKLQRTGTLPTVWIPPAGLRDRRDLHRTRLALSSERVRLKNRIHATLAKYALSTGMSDSFGVKGLAILNELLKSLPCETRYSTEILLQQLNFVQGEIDELERRIEETLAVTPELELIKTLPCVGSILGSTILLEIGDIERFPTPQHLASYSGTTPRVHSSGGKTRYGTLRSDVNRYLKWAFVEAANKIVPLRERWAGRHVVKFYNRLVKHKGHQKAVGAVARHLAESAFWVLKKKEPYRDPQIVPYRRSEG